MTKTINATPIPRRINKSARGRLIKIQQQQLRKALKTHFFALEPQTMSHVLAYDTDLNRVGMTLEFSELLNRTPLKWRVDCYILSREKNGKNKLQGDTIITYPCKHPEIQNALCDYHWNMINDFRASAVGDNFITAAWIASEEGTKVTDEQAYQIFSDCGAWLLESDWEEAINKGKQK